MDNVLKYNTEIHKKIVFKNKHEVLVVTIYNGNRIVSLYNFSNIKNGIYYTPKVRKPHGLYAVGVLYGEMYYSFFLNGRGATDRDYITLPTDNNHYPFYAFVAESETETLEEPTETIMFPPRETPLEFIERMHARIFHITQRIQVLRHEEPHQNALSEKICREVPEDHDEVLRYDISCNLIKRPIGWLALQMENYESKYQRHLTAVETAQKANRAIPNFNDQNDRNSIETMREKIETSLTEECLRDHFDLHRTSDWNPVQNTQRKITLCNDDANRTPGEVLVDVNAFFTDGRGNVNERGAKKTYHEISTKYWVKAKRTSHRKLVTERTIEI